jgi:hypothetical protein
VKDGNAGSTATRKAAAIVASFPTNAQQAFNDWTADVVLREHRRAVRRHRMREAASGGRQG